MNELSKKQQNRILTTLKRSQLDVFDVDGSHENLTTLHSEVCENLAQYPNSTMNIMETFLIGSNSEIDHNSAKLFSSVDKTGTIELFNNVERLENKQISMSDFAITTVYGATENMPLRGLLYLLPAINLVEALRSINNTELPQINFVFMNDSGSIVNGMDRSKVDLSTADFIKIAEKYIVEYHPDVQNHVKFLVDNSITSKIIESGDFEDISRMVSDLLDSHPGLKSRFVEYGERRSVAEKSMSYVALHPLTQDLILPDKDMLFDEFHTSAPAPDSSLFTMYVGAKPEENFYRSRKICAGQIAKDFKGYELRETAQYLTKIEKPPYSQLKEGELFIERAIDKPDEIVEARPRNRHTGDHSEYGIAVQKAVDSIEHDINNSKSEMSLIEFLQNCQ